MKFLKALLIGLGTCIIAIIAPLGGVAVAVITILSAVISWIVDNLFNKNK